MAKKIPIEVLFNISEGDGRDMFRKYGYVETLREQGMNFGQIMAKLKKDRKRLMKKIFGK